MCMLSDVEFHVLAEEVVEALRPSFTGSWAEIIDSEMGGGECFVAVDDALQATALAGFGIPPTVVSKVYELLEDASEEDRNRAVGWMHRANRKTAA